MRVKDEPNLLLTRPVITRSGRSMVLATAITISLEAARVGQLKKLYTTSCFVVISWSSSSIKTTLTPIQMCVSQKNVLGSAPCMTSRSRSLARAEVFRQLLQGFFRADLEMALFRNIMPRHCFPKETVCGRWVWYPQSVDLDIGERVPFLQ